MKRRSKGEGTIYRRPNGTWTASTYVTLPNGHRKRVSVSAKTQDVVKTKLRELQENENRHIAYVDKDWAISEYLDYWLNEVQKDRIRETTMLLYSSLIEKYLKPVLGGHKLLSLSVRDVRYSLNELQKRSCTPRTLQKCLQVLKTCLNCAVREELIHRNVALLVEKPKYAPKQTEIWTAEQASHFLQSIREHPHYVAFLLLLTYGMRRGEALGLRFADIDFDNRVIHLHQQIDRINGRIVARNLKTENSHRTLPLMSHVRDALLEHAQKNGVTPQFNPYVKSIEGTVIVSRNGKPLEPRYFLKCFRLLAEKAGLPQIKIHATRHTAATILKDLNVPIKDVQLILGHANISTTLSIYQHGTPETHRTAISAIENKLVGYVPTIVN